MIKAIGRELGWCILVCSSLLIKYMPSGIIKALQKIISGTASLLLRSRNNVALNNLNYVYAKEKNKKEIRHILKSFMRNIIEYYCELIKQDNKAYKDIKELVHLEGRENLDKALGKGWWKELRNVKSARTKFQGVFGMHKLARKPSSKRAKVKYIQAGKGNIEVAIYKDTVRIFVLTKKNPEVILIQNREIANGLKNYWKFMWQHGKEAKKR